MNKPVKTITISSSTLVALILLWVLFAWAKD